MARTSAADNAIAQGIAAYVRYLESMRAAELAATLEEILIGETDELAKVASREARAVLYVDVARLNVEGLVNANRGGTNGIHGFIAEYAETGVANAERAFAGVRPLTRVLADNGPADLNVWGRPIQMKFYANPQGELLQSVKYRDMKMMFPKDHFEIFDRIMRGDSDIELDGSPLSPRKIDAIRALIEHESAARGESYSKWMRPSKLNYSEVQVNAIGDTLDDKATDLRQRAGDQRQQVRDDSDARRADAVHRAAPSWGEAAKVTSAAAAVQGGVAFATFVYRRRIEGTEIWQFDSEDWCEGGIEAVKGGGKGGITGLSIYGLTQVCQMSAPAAAAVASGTIALAIAVANRRAGKLDDDEFTDLVFCNALESTGAALGAALGQIVIPIPVMGAVMGSIAARVLLGQGKKFLNEAERAAIEQRAAQIGEYVAGLDADLQAEYIRITAKRDYYRDLQKCAFDVSANVKLQLFGTIELARAVGVQEGEILHSVTEADAYFLGSGIEPDARGF